MGVASVTLSVMAVITAVIAALAVLPNRQAIPKHLLGHPYVELPNFLDQKTMDELMELTKSAPIPNAAREYDTYKTMRDEIGEGVPFNKSVGCPAGKLLIPNGEKTKCVFPGRIDVGRHFIRTGGPEGLKEPYAKMVARTYAFMRYLFDYDKHEVSKRLLEAPEFVKLAKSVCPVDKQVLDPIQMNFVCAFPGQTVATHIDAPYFQRASRFHFPQWLLVAMVFSGLFQDEFIHQVQLVGYYHQWNDDGSRKGNFLLYDTEALRPKVRPPTSGSANAVDGSKSVHAAEVYMPERDPPPLQMGAVSEARWIDENKTWNIYSNDQFLTSYPEDEVRFSVVYRARCFKDEAEQAKYHEDQKNPMSLEEIYGVFQKDLARRGLWRPSDNLSPYDWGMLLMDTYIRYPLPADTLIPYNWCVLDRVYPSLARLTRWFC